MMDIFKQWAAALTPAIPWLVGIFVAFGLFVIVYLFIQFQKNPEKTRVAVMLEIASLRKLRQVFTRKDDLIVTGSGEIVKPNLGQTISQPLDRSITEPPTEKKS